MKHTFDENTRLDKAVSVVYPDLSRSQAAKLIEAGKIKVNGKAVGKAAATFIGEVDIEAELEEKEQERQGVSGTNVLELFDLRIIYEDEDILVVNKPQGMVVHHCPGHIGDTVVDALAAMGVKLSSTGGVSRAGIVHRLDKDTSGLMVVAKNDIAHKHLQEQISTKSAIRKYLAIVNNPPAHDEGQIEGNIGRHPTDRLRMAMIKDERYKSRPALTYYKVLERYKNRTGLLELTLSTGRTHQIRVHLASIGSPVVGDITYNRTKSKYEKQFLHAYHLELDQPITGKHLVFEAEPPQEFKELIEKWR